MARYTDDSRERVRDAVDFAELVGARTELRAAGQRRLTGLCPFHDERTPSFGIDPVEKLYHCFGCGAGGDVFKFVMETEGLDFAGALESLAARAGIELEREAEDPRDAERRSRRERLLAVLERTAAYYVRVLWESAEAAPARAYLAERGLEESALREHRVGYAPSAWDKVLTASRRAGYTEEELLAAGLIARGRDGRGVYDRFRRRIMFPLADERGRVLGFGARALSPDQKPKYLNTSESDLFHKGRMVYGADLARAAAAKAGRVVLVEGYTDVIALRQAGVTETVCSMGTALTDDQVHALRRLAPAVLLCQDPDAAGQEAVAKSLALLERGSGLEARVVRLPAGKDPADVVQQDGVEAMRARLADAVPVARFEVERALEQGELGTPEGRDRALSQIAPVIGRLGPGLLQDDLVRLVAGRLGMSESLAQEALRRAPRPRAPAAGTGTAAPRAPPPRVMTSMDKVDDVERAFLARCLAVKSAGRRALEELDLDAAFSTELTRRAAHYLAEHLDTPGQSLPSGADDLARLVGGAGHPLRPARGRSGGAHARALHARQAAAGPPDRRHRPRGGGHHAAGHRAPARAGRDLPPAGLERVGGRGLRRGRALRAVDGAHDLGRVRDADEAELGVVGAGRVEVDGADAHDALEQRLVRVDVLHPLHARLLRALGEQAAPDVEPLRGQHVLRRHPLHEAHDHQDREHDHAEQDAQRPARGQDADHQRDRGDRDAAQVEEEQRPPRRVPLEDDLLAGVQVHGAERYPSGDRTSVRIMGGDRTTATGAAARRGAVAPGAWRRSCR